MHKYILFLFLLSSLPFITRCQEVHQDSLADKRYEWSKSGLKFSDFRVIEDSAFDTDAQEAAARTNYHLSYKYRRKGDSLYFSIGNYFVYGKSWMQQKAVGNKYLLKHEQGHFDLSEIYARTIATEILKFHFTADYKEQIKQIVTYYYKKIHEANALYDNETKHSREVSAQDDWNERIKTHLAALPPVEDKIFVTVINKE